LCFSSLNSMDKNPSWEANISWSTNSQPLMESEYSLPCLKQAALSHYYESDKHTSYNFSVVPILILFSRPHLGLSSRIFSTCFPTKMLYKVIMYSCVLHSRPSQPSCFGHLNIVWREQLRSSSLFSFLQPLFTCSLLDPIILPSSLLSNTFSLCSFTHFGDHFSRLCSDNSHQVTIR
jgi:hypothetical protein